MTILFAIISVCENFPKEEQEEISYSAESDLFFFFFCFSPQGLGPNSTERLQDFTATYGIPYTLIFDHWGDECMENCGRCIVIVASCLVRSKFYNVSFQYFVNNVQLTLHDIRMLLCLTENVNWYMFYFSTFELTNLTHKSLTLSSFILFSNEVIDFFFFYFSCHLLPSRRHL